MKMKSMTPFKFIMVPFVILHLSKGLDFLIALSTMIFSTLNMLNAGRTYTVISAVKSKIWSPIALDMVYPQHSYLLLKMFVYQMSYVSIKSVEIWN